MDSPKLWEKLTLQDMNEIVVVHKDLDDVRNADRGSTHCVDLSCDRHLLAKMV